MPSYTTLDNTALVPSGKYIPVYDNNGNPKILDQPLSAGILAWNGTDLYWADGSSDKPIKTQYQVATSAINGAAVLVQRNDGIVFKLTYPLAEDGQAKYLQIYNGQLTWASLVNQIGDNGVISNPSTGSGFLGRDTVDSDVKFVGPGIPYQPAGGSIQVISNGSNGQVFTLVNGSPQWQNLPSGSASAGGALGSLNAIVGNNTSSSAVNIQAKRLVAAKTDGTTVTLSSVNVSANLTSSAGVGGLDTGTENSSTWYYVYVVSDGTNVGLVISTNGSAPDSSNLGMYLYYVLVSVFRNDGSGNIVTFIQRGNDFWTNPIVVADPASVATSFNALSTGVLLTTVLPPNVRTCRGNIGGSYTAGASGARPIVIAASNSGLAFQAVADTALNTSNYDGFSADIGYFERFPILDSSAPVIYWKAQSTATNRRVTITGYSI